MYKQQPKQPDLLLIGKLLIAGALVLVLIAAGVISYHWLSDKAPPPTTKNIHVAPIITASHDGNSIAAVSQRYMTALLQGQYDVMWSMLHPQIQTQWPDKESFANYWKLRFQGYKLRSFSQGSASDRTYWINPETMISYNQVSEIPVSLQLDPDMPAQQLARLAPQFQQPDQIFQNLPFIVQKQPGGSGQQAQWLVLCGGPADPEAPLLATLTPIAHIVRVPILMYHYISRVPAYDPNPSLRADLSVSPTLFSQQLDYLKAQHYHSITFNQLMNALYYQVPLPSKPIIFTFDDGYVDAYQNAYPILKAHGFSGMFYIITGKIGWAGQASWRQLQEMLANGMQMGSHTVHHVGLGAVYLKSAEEARQEVMISQLDLQRNLGIVIQHFCYPSGDPFKGTNVLLQQKIASLLATTGYIDATTDPGPTGVVQRSMAPFVLLRLRVHGQASLQTYINMLSFYNR